MKRPRVAVNQRIKVNLNLGRGLGFRVQRALGCRVSVCKAHETLKPELKHIAYHSVPSPRAIITFLKP